MRGLIASLVLSLVAPAVIAEENPLTADSRSVYTGVQKILLSTAGRVPEEKYSFRPVETVRTFGQILGHVADAQYAFCAAVLGEKNPRLNIEKTKTSKSDLIAALENAFAYCDKAYANLTDKTGSETVKFMRGEKTRLGVLSINQTHTIEHYGNLVTYMRINGIIPPTSDPDFMKALSE